MHAHKILWALTCYEWAHTSYLCAAIHYSWSPKHVAIFTHLWSPMILCVVSHAIAVVAHNTACTTTMACGCATIVVHGHPGKIWSLTRFAGQPRIANGHPHCAMWLRMSCTCTPMLVHTVWTMGTYMYAHANMWARIIHAHARRNGKTPTPKGSRRFGSRCGLWLYSKAITA